MLTRHLRDSWHTNWQNRSIHLRRCWRGANFSSQTLKELFKVHQTSATRQLRPDHQAGDTRHRVVMSRHGVECLCCCLFLMQLLMKKDTQWHQCSEARSSSPLQLESASHPAVPWFWVWLSSLSGSHSIRSMHGSSGFRVRRRRILQAPNAIAAIRAKIRARLIRERRVLRKTRASMQCTYSSCLWRFLMTRVSDGSNSAAAFMHQWGWFIHEISFQLCYNQTFSLVLCSITW